MLPHSLVETKLLQAMSFAKLISHIWLCLSFCSIASTIPLSPHAGDGYRRSSIDQCQIIQAKLLESLKNNRNTLLAMNDTTLIHLHSENSFLVRANPNSLDSPGALSTDQQTESHDVEETRLLELEVFADIVDHQSELAPISNCHGELAGEGGSVSLLLEFQKSVSSTLSLGLSPTLILPALELTAKVSLGASNNLANTVTCNVEHGEIVQVFMRGVRTVSYHLAVREMSFDHMSGEIVNQSVFRNTTAFEFRTGYSLSEYLCATNTMEDLKCFYRGPDSFS